MTEETQKTCPPLSLLSALCPLFRWCRRVWVVSPVAEKPPASTAALLHSERVPQSGPANSVLRSSYTTGLSLSVLFVCAVCLRVTQMSVSRVSSNCALLCLRQGLWLNLKPMHGAGIVSTTYHIRIQTQVLLLVWQALYQLRDTPKVSFLNSQLNICLHVH